MLHSAMLHFTVLPVKNMLHSVMLHITVLPVTKHVTFCDVTLYRTPCYKTCYIL